MTNIENYLIENFLLFKTIHIIAVICWMVGLLYLPRLFVYHTSVEKDSETAKIFLTMERRLLRYIMLPSMIITLIFGLLLTLSLDWKYEKWLHIKVVLVLGLLALHYYFSLCYKAFSDYRNSKSSRFFKILNEVPTLLMIIIIILVVIKPF